MHRRRSRLTRSLLALAITAAGFALVSPSANASDNGNWSVAPTGTNGNTPRDWFEYSLRPGEVIRDLVSVSNKTSAIKTFKLYATDAYDTPLNGAFALLQRDQTTKEAGSWIQLGFNNVTVPANSRADLAFQITVPPDAHPGDHAAGIVAEDTSQSTATPAPGKNIQLQQRVATRVYIRVAGALQPSLRVTQLVIRHQDPLLPPLTGNGQAEIAYEVANTGNVRLTGTALLKVEGLFGRTLKSYKLQDLPELLPGARVAFAQRWTGPLPIIDHLSANVTLKADGINSHWSKGSWKIPWIELLILAVVLLLFGGRRRYRRWRDTRPPAPPTTSPTRQEAVLV